MLWFVFVAYSLQLCCVLICVGFMAHTDLLSCILLVTLFGYYFVTAADGYLDFKTSFSDGKTTGHVDLRATVKVAQNLSSARSKCKPQLTAYMLV